MNYFNLGEVFSFLEDLISLGQGIGSYGLVNTHVTRVLGHPASSGISISTTQHRLSAFLAPAVRAAEFGFS